MTPRRDAKARRRIAISAGLVFAATSAAGPLVAQTRPPGAIVRVFVIDSAGSAITGADLGVVRGLAAPFAHATTDSYGRATLSFAADSGDYDIVFRKIGYPRADRYFIVGPRDSMSLSFVVPAPRANTLDTVKVTAAVDLKTKRYYVNADAIEASTRPLFNAWDILTKLRPDILDFRPGCGDEPMNLWVNGKRIRYVPVNFMAVARERNRSPGNNDVMFALYEIQPEHVAEIRYRDCFDTTVPDVGGMNAVFVVLKAGVIYEPGEGSFVIDTWPPKTPER